MKKNILPISVVVSGTLISVTIYYGFGFDEVKKLFSIVGSLSIAVALLAYFYKKNQDRTVAAIEQISFFRKEIIPEWEKVAAILRAKNKKYMFSWIKLDEPTMDFMREKYPRNFQDQTTIFLNKFDDLKTDTEVWDAKILDSQIKLFNMLEEFSLRVHHFRTIEHEALNAVRYAFVEIIEKNAAALIFVRDVVVENPIYEKTLTLYNFWRHKAKHPFIIKNLFKYGFITKQQKQKILGDMQKSKNMHENQKKST